MLEDTFLHSVSGEEKKMLKCSISNVVSRPRTNDILILIFKTLNNILVQQDQELPDLFPLLVFLAAL